jgi:SPP1 gp7 family putative phage head morphogenesis protein
MAINRKKLESAFRKARRAKGVSVPASAELAAERIVEPFVMKRWEGAAEAALKIVPVGDYIADVSQRQISKAINKIYRSYSGLTSLDRKLKAAYERGNEEHKARYLYEMERALGVDATSLLKEERARKDVQKRLKASIDLIVTLEEDLKVRLAREIWNGVSIGENRGALRRFILERKAGYPSWRAKLIARDQTAKLFSNLSQTRQEDLGIERYIWRTVGDGAVRDSHYELRDLTFEWSKPPDVGHPGEDIQCRCVADPDTSSAKFLQ